VLWSAVAVLGTLISARYTGRAVRRLGHRLPSVEGDQNLQASRVARYVVLTIGATVLLAVLCAPVEPRIAVVLLVLTAVVLMAGGVADDIGAGLVLRARHPVKVGDLVTSCGNSDRTLDRATVQPPHQRLMKDPLVHASTLGQGRSEPQVRVPVRPVAVVEDSEARLLGGRGFVLAWPPPPSLTRPGAQ
jgi:small conductance mechanosensitive channel